MRRALVTFLVLMTMLGVGTIMVVEKFTHEQILPRNFHGVINEFNRVSLRTRLMVNRWWNKMLNKKPALSIPVQEKHSAEKKIIKWQDGQGVWHYEYQTSVESKSP